VFSTLGTLKFYLKNTIGVRCSFLGILFISKILEIHLKVQKVTFCLLLMSQNLKEAENMLSNQIKICLFPLKVFFKSQVAL